MFQQNQELSSRLDQNKEQLIQKSRECSELRQKLDEANFTIDKLESDVQGQKNSNQEIKRKKDEDQKRFSNQ